jgi:hypothetical protein
MLCALIVRTLRPGASNGTGQAARGLSLRNMIRNAESPDAVTCFRFVDEIPDNDEFARNAPR